MSQKIDLSQLSVFDRKLGEFLGLNDSVKSGEAVIRAVPTLGLGGTETFIVQTVRRKDEGDYVFVERVSDEGTVRMVLPPSVTAAIARQREGNTTRSRRASSRAVMAERMADGYVPAPPRRKARR